MPSAHESMFNAASAPVIASWFGVSVFLSRGSLVTETFTARRNDREHSALGQEYGLEISIVMRDFLLPVGSVVLDGDTIEPRVGDEITEGDEVFRILPPDSVKPAVELQAGGYDWLVHTTRIQKSAE